MFDFEKLIIIKNISREGAGLLEEELKKQAIGYTTVDMEQGDVLPAVGDYKAVIVLGGPDSANDVNKKMLAELAFIREIIAADIPYLGICLGLQTLVKAAGGKVVKCPIKEIGFIGSDGKSFEIELTEQGRQDPLFAGLENKFPVFQLHGETVELTEDMQLLAIGKFCKNQVVKVGSRAYGIQCHFELTSEMLNAWLADDPDLLQRDTEQVRANFRAMQDEYTRVGRKLFRNFLTLAGLL